MHPMFNSVGPKMEGNMGENTPSFPSCPSWLWPLVGWMIEAVVVVMIMVAVLVMMVKVIRVHHQPLQPSFVP